MADRSRGANLTIKASNWEDADFTAGHRSYRSHLENVRALMTSIEYTVARDGDEIARWMRQHSKRRDLVASRCWRIGWLDAFLQALRFRWKGKLVTELVDDAAQAAVMMAQIHAEYLEMERSGVPENGRYGRGA